MIDHEEGLLRKQALNRQDRTAVEHLAALCRRDEGLDLAWLMEPPGDLVDRELGHLLYHVSGALVGFMSLPSGPEVELCGLVHPEHRRKGIGRALLSAAREEYRQRGVEE